LDLARVDGAYVLVMEHVEGCDAHHLLGALRRAGHLLPVDLAAHVIAEVCRGLDYAHGHQDERGEPTSIIHRDVSPQNILLSFAGEVKLADFGIAKAKWRPSDPNAGVIKGKYFYMSPEQAWAEPLDHRSDIFSAGVVLWELLVGERLHQAKRIQPLLDAVRRAEVPAPSSLRGAVPGELDAIVARATALNRVDRYANAGKMADALTAYLASREPIHASRQIAEMLAGIAAPSSAGVPMRASGVPQTRDHVVTQSVQERPTPREPPLCYDLDEGESTVAGWRSPRAQNPAHTWLWALGAGSLLVGLVVWLLYGS
jgi:serine/threonine protein kinase